MSLAAFISSQRTEHGVPHATVCRALGVSPSWFYKWHERPPSVNGTRKMTPARHPNFDPLLDDSGSQSSQGGRGVIRGGLG